eukprot:scaffold34674_cov171-Amphora_coffeaeformis.AAC.9
MDTSGSWRLGLGGGFAWHEKQTVEKEVLSADSEQKDAQQRDEDGINHYIIIACSTKDIADPFSPLIRLDDAAVASGFLGSALAWILVSFLS